MFVVSAKNEFELNISLKLWQAFRNMQSRLDMHNMSYPKANTVML